jgi:hypothetical protein
MGVGARHEGPKREKPRAAAPAGEASSPAWTTVAERPAGDLEAA